MLTTTHIAQSNAAHGSSLDDLLSAFGVSADNPFLMPENFLVKYEMEWAKWINTKAGAVVEGDKLTQVVRILKFVQRLTRLGHKNVFTSQLKIGGKRVVAQELIDNLLTAEIRPLLKTMNDVAKKADLYGLFKTVYKKIELRGTNLITVSVLERKRSSEALEKTLLRLRAPLKFKAIPPALTERMVVTRKAKPPHVTAITRTTTPTAQTLLSQWSQTTNWLKVHDDKRVAMWLIRAREKKLILKVYASIHPELVTLVPPVTLYKLWNAAVRKSR